MTIHPSREVSDLPLHRLAHELQARRLSPVDLVDGVLERIARLDPKLHAFIAVYSDEARAAAKAADGAIARGEAPTRLVIVPRRSLL